MGRYKTKGTSRTPELPRDAEAEQAGLPELTDKEFVFVNALLSGKNQSDAYREAYDAENMAPASVWSEASKRRNSPKVTQWLDYILENGAEDLTVTKESHIRELESIKRQALAKDNYGAAVQAEQLKGKASGLYTERMEVVGDGSDLATIQSRLKQELGDDLAQAVMAKRGLPWVI